MERPAKSAARHVPSRRTGAGPAICSGNFVHGRSRRDVSCCSTGRSLTFTPGRSAHIRHGGGGPRRRKARLGQRLGCFALVRADSRPTVRQNVTCGRNTGGAGQRKGPNVISTDNDRETYHLYFLFTRRRFQCKRHAAVLHRSSGTGKLLARRIFQCQTVESVEKRAPKARLRVWTQPLGFSMRIFKPHLQIGATADF